MVGFVRDVHPLILDTLVVSIFVLIIFFGIIRGIKKTLINFSLLIASILLSFTSIMNSVKNVFVLNFLKISEWVPSSSDKAYKVAATAFTNLLASLCVFLLIYAILHVLTILFGMLGKKKEKEKEKEVYNKGAASRAFGAVVSFLYQGAIVVFIMIFMNNNLIGMDDSIGKSTVTKFIVKQSSNTLNNIEKGFTDELLLKVVKGDLLYSPEPDVVEDFAFVIENADILFMDKDYIGILDNEKLTDVEAYGKIKIILEDLGKIASVVNEIDDFGKCEKEFVDLSEQWINEIHRTATIKDLDKIEFTINKLGTIRKKLEDVGVNDKILALYDEITIGK